MALYKQSIDFLPKPTKEEVEDKYKVSKAGVYAALLPLLAALIWLIAMVISTYFKSEVSKKEETIRERESTIASYNQVRLHQTELVLKIEELKEIVIKDFYPQKFFNEVSRTIRSTGDAQAEVYAYGREQDGTFSIKGMANSYLDLAKIMVAFNLREEFNNVLIDSIYYDREKDNVNFQISFLYSEEEEIEESI